MTQEPVELSSVRFDVVHVEVRQPERWWFATRRLLSEITDPDVDDGAQRHGDRDELRWNVLAEVLTAVTRALQSGDHRPSELDELTAIVPIPRVAGGLTAPETEVLGSWFTHEEAPRADAWSLAPANGRHRLWNIWLHSPSAIVPIRSVLLDLTDDVATEYHAAAIRSGVAAGLASVPAAVRASSPAYIAELARAHGITPTR